MEIVLERIAKKNTYTIGRLYLLADDDVKRKVLSGKSAGDKRSFEHTFDMKKLSKDSLPRVSTLPRPSSLNCCRGLAILLP